MWLRHNLTTISEFLSGQKILDNTLRYVRLMQPAMLLRNFIKRYQRRYVGRKSATHPALAPLTPENYSRFKERAAALDISMTDAWNDAVELWLGSTDRFVKRNNNHRGV
jgi:hypothetical protein